MNDSVYWRFITANWILFPKPNYCSISVYTSRESYLSISTLYLLYVYVYITLISWKSKVTMGQSVFTYLSMYYNTQLGILSVRSYTNGKTLQNWHVYYLKNINWNEFKISNALCSKNKTFFKDVIEWIEIKYLLYDIQWHKGK